MNKHGQADEPKLTLKTNLHRYIAVNSGNAHNCAIAMDGSSCWGQNEHGQANGHSKGVVSQLAVGSFHNCSITAGGINLF